MGNRARAARTEVKAMARTLGYDEARLRKRFTRPFSKADGVRYLVSRFMRRWVCSFFVIESSAQLRAFAAEHRAQIEEDILRSMHDAIMRESYAREIDAMVLAEIAA